MMQHFLRHTSLLLFGSLVFICSAHSQSNSTSAKSGALLSTGYDPVAQSRATLRSLYNLKETAIWVSIEHRLFEPIKPGETEGAVVDRLIGNDALGNALKSDGRIEKNLSQLLSSKLASNYSVKTVDWKVAPYRIFLRSRIIQSLNMYGKNMFEVYTELDVQEFATSNSGLNDFMFVSRYYGQAFTSTKEGIEGGLYESLDKSLEGLGDELKKAKAYCERDVCLLPKGSLRGFNR